MGNKYASAYERFRDSMTFAEGECWIWTGGKNKDGYGRFQVDGRKVFAHRWSHEYYVGVIPEGLSVLHKCDVPACVNPEHLYVGSQLQNVKDRDDRKRTARGEKNGRAKATRKTIDLILAAIRAGATKRQAAEAHGISKSAVDEVVAGRNWKI